ncbi:MAG: hypothetical protein Q9192_003525 [Flavoplaca navasiana]
MTGNPPPTPPSTAPTSPTHLSEHGHGNCVINVGTDPEKDGDNNEAYSDPSRSPTLADQGPGAKKMAGKNTSPATVDDHPKGYPKLAAFMNSSDNFLMSRRFSFLHSRVLLHRQDELAEMEKALIAMDDEDQELDQLSLESRRRDDQRPEEPSRKSLMTKIDNKLKDYDDLIARIRRSVAIPRPLDRDYGSLYRWIDDLKPLCREESKFIKYQDDMIALAEKQEGGWFDGFLLTSPEERKKTDDEYVQLYSKYRVDVLARLILTVVAVVLLMVPTAVLFLVQEHGILKIMLIMIFTMLFSAALSVFTKAKRHEMFAATAAYCAVLVVFLGNLGPSPS